MLGRPCCHLRVTSKLGFALTLQTPHSLADAAGRAAARQGLQ